MKNIYICAFVLIQLWISVSTAMPMFNGLFHLPGLGGSLPNFPEPRPQGECGCFMLRDDTCAHCVNVQSWKSRKRAFLRAHFESKIGGSCRCDDIPKYNDHLFCSRCNEIKAKVELGMQGRTEPPPPPNHCTCEDNPVFDTYTCDYCLRRRGQQNNNQAPKARPPPPNHCTCEDNPVFDTYTCDYCLRRRGQ